MTRASNCSVQSPSDSLPADFAGASSLDCEVELPCCVAPVAEEAEEEVEGEAAEVAEAAGTRKKKNLLKYLQ